MSTARLVDVFFDPNCPWTWKTAQWLRRTGAEIRWRAFSLEMASSEPVPDMWASAAAASRTALRLVERLAALGRHDDAGRFYAALGARVHDELTAPSVDLVRHTAEGLGFTGDDIAALDDPELDDAVRAALDEARSLVGDGLGSPVLADTTAAGAARSAPCSPVR